MINGDSYTARTMREMLMNPPTEIEEAVADRYIAAMRLLIRGRWSETIRDSRARWAASQANLPTFTSHKKSVRGGRTTEFRPWSLSDAGA